MYSQMPLNNSNRIKYAIVRIYDTAGNIVGGGFLVTSWQILTCSHVVEKALGLKMTEFPLNCRVRIDFPFLGASAPIFARVGPMWNSESPFDTARLQIETPIYGALPIPLCITNQMHNHPIRTFGFPNESGVWSSGIVFDHDANGRFQLNNTDITHGFSGCPVWDDHLGGVVGMVSVKLDNFKKGTAFFIPSSMLLQLWDEFPLHWHANAGQAPTVPYGWLRMSDGSCRSINLDPLGNMYWF